MTGAEWREFRKHFGQFRRIVLIGICADYEHVTLITIDCNMPPNKFNIATGLEQKCKDFSKTSKTPSTSYRPISKIFYWLIYTCDANTTTQLKSQ